MIALDTWSGFYILLIIPLLYLQQKRTSAQREVPITLFSVLARRSDEDPTPYRRILHFTRNQRFLLLTIVLLSLALTFNGVHIVRKYPEPGKWLVLLDNTPGSSARFENGTVLSEMVSRLKVFSRRTYEEDLFTLVVTSPSPVIFYQLDRKAFTTHLSGIESAAISSGIVELATTTNIMRKSVDFKGAILVSPRSQRWRRYLADEQHDPDISIPPDQELMTGNAGFTAIDITPVAGDLYNVYGRIVSENLETDQLDVSLDDDNGPSVRFTVNLNMEGEGEFHLLEIPLTAPATILQLEINDNLASDNQLTITHPIDRSVITVQLQGNERDFLKIALAAFQELNPVSDHPASDEYRVTIYEKTVPKVRRLTSPSLFIFPPESFGPFNIQRIWATPMGISLHPGHPVTRSAVFRRFRTSKVLHIQPPAGFKTLASAQGIPLILAGTMDGHRVTVWTFDPEDNGIYLDPAFPILLRDTLMWLAHAGEVQVESESCITGTGSGGTGPEECASLIREAGSISLPDLTGIADNPRLPRSETRKDLGKMFLILALGILLILAADRALYREEIL